MCGAFLKCSIQVQDWIGSNSIIFSEKKFVELDQCCYLGRQIAWYIRISYQLGPGWLLPIQRICVVSLSMSLPTNGDKVRSGKTA